MIASRVIKKDRLMEFLQNLMDKYTVFVPSYKNSEVHFERLSDIEFIILEYFNFLIPPVKIFCFHPTWKKYTDLYIEDIKIENDKEILLFGVRPCDMRSFLLLDLALKDNLIYKEKRKRVFTIILGCNSLRENCFCIFVRGSPVLSDGADVFMIDIGESFVIEDISGRLRDYLLRLPEANLDKIREKERINKKAFDVKMELDIDDLSGKLQIIDKLDPEKKRSLWHRLAESCTNCGKCIALCPTCHCYFIIEDILDIVIDEKGEKAKSFDPCMINICLSERLENSTPLGYHRLQRRVMDKFYHSFKTLGQPLCVGCGRCITGCEGNIDLKDILKQLNEIKL